MYYHYLYYHYLYYHYFYYNYFYYHYFYFSYYYNDIIYIFSCDIRPGPEYVLRVYYFSYDGHYKLIQHHYWDESCSSPKWTIISYGFLKILPYISLHPDAIATNPRAFNVTITPQDHKAAKELDSLVAGNCPSEYNKNMCMHLLSVWNNNHFNIYAGFSIKRLSNKFSMQMKKYNS